nr:MAG TPA: hypothetical protein [Caudoviricetes sp.]
MVTKSPPYPFIGYRGEYACAIIKYGRRRETCSPLASPLVSYSPGSGPSTGASFSFISISSAIFISSSLISFGLYFGLLQGNFPVLPKWIMWQTKPVVIRATTDQ